MKKLLFLILALFVATASTFAQNPPASPRLTAESGNVKVAYGAPSKKGRDIFGALVPFGKVWRVGANEATEITFAKDGIFGGAAIKAGTYTLFAIPEADSWTVILNPTLKQWGAYGYDKIKDADVAKVKASVSGTEATVEQLRYNLDENNLTIEWDNVRASVPLKF